MLFLETWCCWSGMDVSHTWNGERLFTHSFGTVMFELTFGVAKFQNLSFTFFQDFYPLKGTFGCGNLKCLDQKFRNTQFFWMSYEKRSIRNIFSFGSSVLCSRNARGPKKDIVFGVGFESLCLCGISPILNIATTNPDILRISSLLAI